jgi:hypothetical protein
VGDSRAYLLRDGRLERLTDDHSMVADLVRHGSLTEEEARFHPQRSVITRALGSDPNMLADVFEVEGEPGDRLLLATDGLTGMLADDYISDILGADPDPERTVHALVDAANRAGGYDNISVVVVDITGEAADSYASPHGTVSAGRRSAARLLWVVAALALIAVTGWGAWGYADSRAYLIEEDGLLAVYRGVPGSFAGIRLSWWVTTRDDVPVARLSAPVAARLKDGIAFGSLRSALDRAAELRASIADTASPDASATPAP